MADRCNNCLENLKKIGDDLCTNGREMHEDVLKFYDFKISEIQQMVNVIRKELRSLGVRNDE